MNARTRQSPSIATSAACCTPLALASAAERTVCTARSASVWTGRSMVVSTTRSCCNTSSLLRPRIERTSESTQSTKYWACWSARVRDTRTGWAKAVARRPFHQPRVQGRFADGELGGGLVEVALGGRFDAVGAFAEIDPVEIEGEDFLLGKLGLQPHRLNQLLHLAPDVLVGAEEQVPRFLLGDGRGALGVTVRAQGDQHHAD